MRTPARSGDTIHFDFTADPPTATVLPSPTKVMPWPAAIDTSAQANALASAIEGDLDDAAAALAHLAADGWALVRIGQS